MNFLINAAFEHFRMPRLLKGGVYFMFPFPNAAFIEKRRLKEKYSNQFLHKFKAVTDIRVVFA